jgi:hypothetical protein
LGSGTTNLVLPAVAAASTEQHDVVEPVLRDCLGRTQNGHRDGQVEVGTCLGQRGR